MEPQPLRHRIPAGRRRPPRLLVRRTDPAGQLGADPDRGLAVHRLRTPAGDPVADAPRHPALGRGLPGRPGLRGGAGAVRPGDRARGGRPGLHAHQERPRVLRPAPAQPPDAAAGREVRRDQQGQGLRHQGRPDQAGLRRRARRRARDPGCPGQRVHRDRADALLHGLARQRQGQPLPAGTGQPPRDRGQPRRPDPGRDRRLRLGRLRRRPVRRSLDAGLPVHRRPRASTPSRWLSWWRSST